MTYQEFCKRLKEQDLQAEENYRRARDNYRRARMVTTAEYLLGHPIELREALTGTRNLTELPAEDLSAYVELLQEERKRLGV